ncbi:MAG: phage head-tail connector protein [Anaerovibrio sp.]|nr:phage head-tail connector protein [Anaerovibrio sp.]
MDINDLKPLLGLEVTDTSKDSVLTFILGNVTEFICNYCHIVEVPKGLEYTAYRMAMDIYRNEGLGEADSEDTPGRVTSIDEGDVKTSFAASRFDSSYVHSLLKVYTPQLNRYRKLVRNDDC